MNEYDEKREQQINALLDGELSDTDSDQLKTAADGDHDLARAIIEAWQLHEAMEAVDVELAPSSLRKRLKAIPREQRPAVGWLQPRWVMALAAIPLVVIAIGLSQPQTPSADEVVQARQDLAVAFAYLDRAGNRAGHQVQSQVGDAINEVVTGTVLRNIKSQQLFSKEKKA